MAAYSLAELSRSGIYEILNTVNGKRYIGSAKCFSQRWAVHRYGLARGSHHSILLQRAWAKYGPDSFEFNILEFCRHKDLIATEQQYIDDLRPEYNICVVAGSSEGRVTSSETKRLLVLAITGKKRSEETKARMREARSRRVVSPVVSDATRAKQSQYRKGRPVGRSKEHAAKIGLARRKFSNTQIKEMKALLMSGAKQADMARKFGCSEAWMSLLANGKRYAEV